MIEKHFNKPLIMTKENEENFKESKVCNICDKEFIEGDKKVIDHCHFTGEYRGAAHNSCNIVFRVSKNIPVVFHNLRGYDSHFLVLEMGNFKRQIGIIPNNFERYMTINWGKFRFIDSFQFMSSSLEKLSNNLPPESMLQTKMHFPKTEEFLLVRRKGVYPYDYFDSMKKFEEKELPTKDKFYNRLNDENVSDTDYLHAKNVWKQFKMKNLGDYHDLYLKTDVVILADVFEEFRKV